MSTVPLHLPNTAGVDAPAVLLPYQQRWIADQSPFKVMEKGRRTGVTWAEASDDVLIAASDRSAGGQNVYYVGTDKEMTEEYIQACAMWAKEFNRAATEIDEGLWGESEKDEKEIKTFTIRFPRSRFKIIALASRPRKLRGRQGVLVGDEAAFQDDLAALKEAAMAFLIWGGKVRLISTHFGVENDFNTIVNEIRAGTQKGTVHRVTFRDAVAEGLYRRVCLRLKKPWTAEGELAWVNEIYAYYGKGADQELDCIPSDSGGVWLSRALIEARMVPGKVLRWECKPGFEQLPEHIRRADCQDWIDEHLAPELLKLDPALQSFFGQDFGRTGDLSVQVPVQLTQALVRRVPFTIELRNVPFKQQEQVCFHLLDRLPRFMHGKFDARGNGQYLAEVAMQRYGATRIDQVMLSETWYRENTAPLKAAFEDGTIELPRDAETLNDLRAFEVVRGVPRIPDRRSTDAAGKKRHGDAGVAILLADAATRAEVTPMEFEALGVTRASAGLDDYADDGRVARRSYLYGA